MIPQGHGAYIGPQPQGPPLYASRSSTNTCWGHLWLYAGHISKPGQVDLLELCFALLQWEGHKKRQTSAKSRSHPLEDVSITEVQPVRPLIIPKFYRRRSVARPCRHFVVTKGARRGWRHRKTRWRGHVEAPFNRSSIPPWPSTDLIKEKPEQNLINVTQRGTTAFARATDKGDHEYLPSRSLTTPTDGSIEINSRSDKKEWMSKAEKSCSCWACQYNAARERKRINEQYHQQNLCSNSNFSQSRQGRQNINKQRDSIHSIRSLKDLFNSKYSKKESMVFRTS